MPLTPSQACAHRPSPLSYDHARQIKQKQDAFCSRALAGLWAGLGDFPEDLQWEALVDVLRGRVRVCALVMSATELGEAHTKRVDTVRFKHIAMKRSIWMTLLG